MTAVRIIFELVLLFAAQIALVDLVVIGGYRPDIILIYMIFRCKLVTGYQFVLLGFLIGLTQDLLGGGFIGLNAMSKTLAAFILAKVFAEEIPHGKLKFYLGVTACILVHDFTYNYVFGQNEYMGFFPFLFRRVLPTSFYNLALVMLIGLIPGKKRR
ncbi:MAG: rod shape-determining protein MreD [FCB group bacterium]|nr:rod shape-determining protein MreD [FCB group bacterium]